MRLRRDDSAFQGAEHTLQTARRLQRKGDRSPTPMTRLLRQVHRTEQVGMTIWTVRPRRDRCIATVLYVYGGGHVHPLTADYWR